MYRLIRNLLPFAVGALWLYLIWRVQLGAPTLDALQEARHTGALRERFSSLEVILCLAGLAAAMVAVDKLWCAFVRRRVGIDPMKVHWSRLRNRNGNFICAACQSIFMLPPEDFSDEGWVHCGDCGHAVAPYGEMKPMLAELRARYAGRWAFRLRG
jgi:hypothetical protein